jgi:imidazolonepropionase
VDLLIRNIRQLVTVAAHGQRVLTGPAMNDPGVIADAGVLCRDGKIAWAGPMTAFPGLGGEDIPEIDATGRVVVPGFVDSHTHMMFAGDRAEEFGMRAQGATYQEIAEKGGGILSTIKHVRAATKKELKRSTSRHLMAMMKHGTTAVEIKTGYGLSMDAEVKMLEGIHELGNEEMATVVGTFLGAHAVPPEFKSDPEAYVRLIIDTMIPYAGKRSLAAFCDVFCERGYFDARQTEEILLAGKAHGMLPKIHAEELTHQGGAELAGRIGAVSADHLEKISPEGIEAGVAVAIASDFNPGSCMSYSMPMMMTIACTHMKMTPAEALVASTLNGAAALNLSATHGSIEAGKQADLLVADIPDYRHLAYHFGTNHIRHTIKNGTILEIP